MKLPNIQSFNPKNTRFSAYATLFLFTSAFVLAIAFVTPFWLESHPHNEQRFRRLGLWQVCFEKFQDPYNRYDQVLSGCKFIYDEDFSFIREFLRPAFFIATQVLFTGGFLLLILVCAGILTVKQYFIIEREDLALRALSIASALPAILCTAGVTIFVFRGDDRDWMPDPEFNYISWSVGIAYFGTLLLWLSSVSYYLDMRQIVVHETTTSHEPGSRHY